MTATRSQSDQARPMSCVIRSSASPRARRRPSSRCSTCARTETSSAETGSSHTIPAGSGASALAIATRCRWPPESSKRIAVPEALRGRQAGVLERGRGAQDALAARHALHAQRLLHELAHAHARVERLVRILEHHLHLAPQRARCRRGRGPRPRSAARRRSAARARAACVRASSCRSPTRRRRRAPRSGATRGRRRRARARRARAGGR